MLPHRKVIDFTGLSLEQAKAYPTVFRLVEQRVKPGRSKLGGYSVADSRREKWWLFGTQTPALNHAKNNVEKVCAISQTSKYSCFGILPAEHVFSHKVVVVCSDNIYSTFAILSSSCHSFWCALTGSTLEDRPVYSTIDCYEAFPFPEAAIKGGSNPENSDCKIEDLDRIGRQYDVLRQSCTTVFNEGLTNTYNRFHDPAVTSPEHLSLRRLHSVMDQMVLAAYGWSDVITAYGFGLDYLDLEDDNQLPYELQERIDSGELFFRDAGDALDFQRHLQACGAISGRSNLPWRYRWPEAVRDDVLARLLALNAERYQEEVAQGLHSKSSKKASGPVAPGAKRRGRPPKSAQAGETGSVQAEQIGLGL